MKTIRELFESFATNVQPICLHVSVRDDENGPYVFALGLKDTHTLQMRKIEDKFALQLWHGKNSEEEYVVDEPEFDSAEQVFKAAEEWLRRDCA